MDKEKDTSLLGRDAVTVAFFDTKLQQTGENELSICIPTYNGAKYVGEAISSVLAQTFLNFELIIVDDCSKDDTETVVKSFNDNRIKFYKNPTRLGLVGNWNRCLELSSGQYVCLFHQDDVMMPDNLAIKVKILQEYPQVGMVYSDILQIGPQGELIREGWFVKPPPTQYGVHKGTEFFKTQLLGPNIVSCPSVVVRRACYEKLGNFDASLPFSTDWEMWMRLALFYDVAYLDKPLVKYRWHDDNETLNFRGVKDLEHSFRAKIVVLDKFPEVIADAKNLRSKVIKTYKQMALDHVLHFHHLQDYDQVKQYLAFALALDQTENKGSPQGSIDFFLEVVDQIWQRNPVLSSPVPTTASEMAKSALPPDRQPIYRQIVDGLSGEEIAQQIPIRKLIKAIAFKLSTKPGFRWLYRYREIGKKVLD